MDTTKDNQIIIEFEPNSFTCSIPPLYNVYYYDTDIKQRNTIKQTILVDGPTLSLLIKLYGYETNDKYLLDKYCGKTRNIIENKSL